MPTGTVQNRNILALLWSFAFLSYLLRTNISVAQHLMARELNLNTIQIGYVFSAFLIGYTLFQVPAGVVGDRFRPHLVLTVCALSWAVTTLLTGLVPGFLLSSAGGALTSLLAIRFLLGVGQSGTYPVAMTAVSERFAPDRHAFLTALIFTGSTMGAAFSPPLAAYLMNAFGWRVTFYVTAVLPLILAGFWWYQSRPAANSGNGLTAPAISGVRVSWWRLLIRRDIFFLCLSYLLYCYSISIFVYWLFKYLADVRHLSVVGSGWATGLPWIVATIFVPTFGHLSTRISRHLGNLAGRRAIATGCLFLAALLMWVGAGAESAGVSIAAIALSVGLLFCTESSYWSTAIQLAKDDAGAAGGLMNFAGNGGGVLSTTLVPVLASAFGWFVALLSGSVVAILAAVFWFVIRANPVSSPATEESGPNSVKIEYL